MQFCRLCLTTSESEMFIDVFHHEITKPHEFIEFIYAVTGVKIKEHEKEFSSICEDCCKQLYNISKMRKLAETNDNILKEKFGKTLNGAVSHKSIKQLARLSSQFKNNDFSLLEGSSIDLVNGITTNNCLIKPYNCEKANVSLENFSNLNITNLPCHKNKCPTTYKDVSIFNSIKRVVKPPEELIIAKTVIQKRPLIKQNIDEGSERNKSKLLITLKRKRMSSEYSCIHNDSYHIKRKSKLLCAEEIRNDEESNGTCKNMPQKQNIQETRNGKKSIETYNDLQLKQNIQEVRYDEESNGTWEDLNEKQLIEEARNSKESNETLKDHSDETNDSLISDSETVIMEDCLRIVPEKEEALYACNMCTFMARSKAALNFHKKRHLKCRVCKQHFTTFEEADIHTKQSCYRHILKNMPTVPLIKVDDLKSEVNCYREVFEEYAEKYNLIHLKDMLNLLQEISSDVENNENVEIYTVTPTTYKDECDTELICISDDEGDSSVVKPVAVEKKSKSSLDTNLSSRELEKEMLTNCYKKFISDSSAQSGMPNVKIYATENMIILDNFMEYMHDYNIPVIKTVSNATKTFLTDTKQELSIKTIFSWDHIKLKTETSTNVDSFSSKNIEELID